MKFNVSSSPARKARCNGPNNSGIGEPVVRLILDALEREPDQWFWALQAITEEDPVPPQARGKVREMARAWIDWGPVRGLGVSYG